MSTTSTILSTILVLEDNPEVLGITKLLLARLPFEVVSASDGLKALEYLKSNPDVTFILSDINMPQMNGLEFLSALKLDPALRNIPVILQTAATEEEIQQGLDSGAELCLRKPFTGVDLYIAINKSDPRSKLHIFIHKFLSAILRFYHKHGLKYAGLYKLDY